VASPVPVGGAGKLPEIGGKVGLRSIVDPFRRSLNERKPETQSPPRQEKTRHEKTSLKHIGGDGPTLIAPTAIKKKKRQKKMPHRPKKTTHAKLGTESARPH